MKRIVYAKEEGGNLAFLVWWQSLDGRLIVEYEDSYDLALKRVKHLESLGRKAQMWRMVDVLKSRETKLEHLLVKDIEAKKFEDGYYCRCDCGNLLRLKKIPIRKSSARTI
ncbi:MAG TPA: hypothetical protein ENH65_03520 [Candidatus Aminicenantes bacterium]|nr:hypothetical protein [Candidatus Aminicenantes bacterium]